MSPTSYQTAPPRGVESTLPRWAAMRQPGSPALPSADPDLLTKGRVGDSPGNRSPDGRRSVDERARGRPSRQPVARVRAADATMSDFRQPSVEDGGTLS